MPPIISANLSYLLLFFARGISLFLFSPLFVHRGIPLYLRMGLTLIFTLILLPHFAQMHLDQTFFSWFLFLKEIVIGYLLGTLFAFMLEGAYFAGRWFGAMAGFSTTELLDPLENQKNPLFVTFFVLLMIALILSLDLHHLFLYALLDSYTLIPLKIEEIQPQALFSLSQSGQYLFSQGLTYLLYPLFFLCALVLFMALLAKFYPELPIFWLGLSIQLFLGLMVLSLLLIFIAPLVQKAFMEILYLITKVFSLNIL